MAIFSLAGHAHREKIKSNSSPKRRKNRKDLKTIGYLFKNKKGHVLKRYTTPHLSLHG